MAKSRSVARIASRVPAPRVVDPLQSLRNFVRTSPWLAIAIAVHVILGTIFAVVQLSHGQAEQAGAPIIFADISPRRFEPEILLDETEPLIDRREIPENKPVEIIPDSTPQVMPPIVELDEDYTMEIGDPNSTEPVGSDYPDGSPGAPGATAIGTLGPGHRGTGPSVLSTPFPGDGRPGGTGTKAPPGRQGGPTEEINEAIFYGMLWLARHQDESGRWSGASCAQACESIDAEHPCQPETALEAGLYSTQADVGLTSLALLTFLGAGLSSNAEQSMVDTLLGRKILVGKDVVLPGLMWLKDQQRPDGSFSDGGAFFLYNEALATLALSEAYALGHNPYWRKPAQKAIDFICRAQKPSPFDKDKKWGWRYQPAEAIRDGAQFGGELSEADMSVTGWMVMALTSAQLAGLEVPRASIEGALDFARWSTGEGGRVGYLGPDTAGDAIIGEHDNYAYHVGTMSSIGMCVRIFLEQDPKDPFLLEGAELLLNDLPAIGKDPDAPQTDYYYWYYGSLALNQLDGPDAPRRTNKYWGPWNKAMNDTILAMQDHTKGACSRGGWMAPDRWSYGFGPVYTTAINVLTLEVYYRYANAFGAKHKPGRAPDAIEADAPALVPPR